MRWLLNCVNAEAHVEVRCILCSSGTNEVHVVHVFSPELLDLPDVARDELEGVNLVLLDHVAEVVDDEAPDEGRLNLEHLQNDWQHQDDERCFITTSSHIFGARNHVVLVWQGQACLAALKAFGLFYLTIEGGCSHHDASECPDEDHHLDVEVELVEFGVEVGPTVADLDNQEGEAQNEQQDAL